MPRHAFILGGTGQIGGAIAKNLLEAGWRVTLAHRGSHALSDNLVKLGAGQVALDREIPGALARALGSGVDALIDVTAYNQDHARQLLDVEGALGALVVISSSSVYRDDKSRTLDEACLGATLKLRVAGHPTGGFMAY